MIRVFYVLLILLIQLESADFMQIAKNFIAYENRDSTILSKESLEKNGKIVGYLYRLNKKGYIIIPNSLLASPIKAFSFTRNYSDLPKAYKTFLINDLYAYKFAEKQKNLAKVVDNTINDRWSFLENFNLISKNERNLKSYIPDTYLLNSNWNQIYPYNKTFPKVGNDITLAGCVAVAQAQLMRYYAYPSFGNGSKTYLASIYNVSNQHYFDNLAYTKTMKAVFHKPYNWDIMPATLDGAEDYQIDEVSYLLKDLVVLNKAKIGIDQTGAILNISGFIENFGYSTDMQEISTSDTSKTDFIKILKSQIDLEQPVLFSFPSHMVVADGYKSDDSGEYIHLNMGWGGAGNDFYDLDASSINSADTVFGTNSIRMVYNIKPCSKQRGDCYVNLEDTDHSTSNHLTGSFENSQDEDKYLLYLNGTTTISSDNGGFFINIYDSNDTLVKVINLNSTPFSVTLNFVSDLYKLKISLNNDSSSEYFQLESYNTNYNIGIDTQDVDESVKQSIEASLEKPTVFDMELKDLVLSDAEKKIRINAYDEDSNLTFSAITNDNIKATFDRNILTLKANNFNTLNNITINVSSPEETLSKNFKILTYPEEIKFGKFFSINDTFDSQEDLDEHKVVLDGTCSIYGVNGYTNQAFYTSLEGYRDMDNSTIQVQNLQRNFYTIDSSLESGSGAYYSYTQGDTHNSYSLYVKCPNASESVEDLIPLLDNYISTDDNLTLPTYTQHIDQNWSLISIPNDTNLTQSEIKTKFAKSKIIWTFRDNNWSAIGLNDSAETLLQNSNIPTISSLHVNDGFWVLTPDQAYDINYSDCQSTNSLNIESSSDNWRLLGTNKDINSSDILQNINIKSIWIYKNAKWFAKSNDTTTQKLYDENNISKVNTVTRGEGFWIQNR